MCVILGGKVTRDLGASLATTGRERRRKPGRHLEEGFREKDQ